MGSPPFFFMYRCLFGVLGLVLPLTTFQCALLEHINVAPSQIYLNSCAMVRAFKVMCPFFNILPNVLVFFVFFRMKLMGKIDWVSLNNVSKKLFEFELNVFHYFKDHLFKVLATDAMVDGLPLIFNRDEKPRFLFY